MRSRGARREARVVRFGSRKWGIGILVMAVVALSMTLILGRYFDAAWAGGEGYRSRSEVTVVAISGSDAICAGSDATRESITTCADQRKQIGFGASSLWLDEKTDFAIANAREGKETLTSHGGRSVIVGPTAIHISNVSIKTAGAMSIVDYSWLQKAEVYAIDGEVTITRGDEPLTVPSGMAARFDTVAPYEPAEAVDYSLESGAAADFYAWAGAGSD